MNLDTPIVVIGDDWGRQPSTTQHIVRRYLGQRPVVWVNGFGHRIPELTLYDLKRAASKVGAMFRPPPLPARGRAPDVIVHPRALPWHNVEAVRTLNMASLRRDIRKALARVAPDRAPLLVTGTPMADGLLGTLGEVASIYLCIDDHAELPYVTAGLIAPREAALLGKVDAVVATAQALVDKKRPASGLAYHLPQGVNYEHFATQREVPAALAALPRPLIGFAGGISRACDLDILVRLATDFPSASVVLVGPISIETAPLTLPNVHLLGPKSYEELPAWVQAFDVGIIPYVLNDWTRAVDPLKLLEYLAAGLPVVATPLPEVAKYANVVRMAGDPAAFSGAVSQALEAGGWASESGRAVAREHTWEARAARFLGIAQEVEHARRGMNASPVATRAATGSQA